MKTKLMSLVAGVSLCTMVGAVQAEPAELSGVQMDQVSAGAVLVIFGAGVADAMANGIGNAQVIGATSTNALIDPLGATTGVSLVVTSARAQMSAISVVNPTLGIGGAYSATNASSAASMQ